ncbi:MAG: hypothetical protein K8W52_04050 [Deltaproteobacteria bacterium]|nr:hypothetical protein [Deltaproteobacteria bacterium]
MRCMTSGAIGSAAMGAAAAGAPVGEPGARHALAAIAASTKAIRDPIDCQAITAPIGLPRIPIDREPGGDSLAGSAKVAP